MRRTAHIDGDRRAYDGITVFFNNEHGEQRAVVRQDEGSVRAALLSCIAEMETWDDGPWHVAVCSTPATIWRDMQGSRELRGLGDSPRKDTATVFPEPNYLGMVGRLDLLAPRHG